jgi:histidinol-phosphatase
VTAPEPTSDEFADDLDLALEMARRADAISVARFRAADLDIQLKADHTHVTDADKAVEQELRAILAQRRPGDGILGEEFGTEGDAARQWILDPIDGTANFLRGVPVWGTLIALAEAGRPVVGVVSAPLLHRRWWARRGAGAWMSEDDGPARQIHVSSVSELGKASLSFQSIEQWEDAGALDRLLRLRRAVWRDRAYGDMWAYMLLAEGLLDIVGEFDVKTYDLAALVPIVEEAGGRFTSIDGEDGPGHGSALATNAVLHPAVLAALR